MVLGLSVVHLTRRLGAASFAWMVKMPSQSSSTKNAPCLAKKRCANRRSCPRFSIQLTNDLDVHVALIKATGVCLLLLRGTGTFQPTLPPLEKLGPFVHLHASGPSGGSRCRFSLDLSLTVVSSIHRHLLVDLEPVVHRHKRLRSSTQSKHTHAQDEGSNTRGTYTAKVS